MSVLCAHCGEELMGAVNRCWKCGRPMLSHSGPLDVPPVRRSPVAGPLNAPLDAAVIDEPTTTTTLGREMRRGSPFLNNTPTLRVAGDVKTAPQTTPRPTTPRTTSSLAASQFVSIVAFCLGLLAWGVSFAIPIATICLALFVIALGIWGLFGSRRQLAIVALMLGCTALAWGAFATLVQIYQAMYGIHPFAS